MHRDLKPENVMVRDDGYVKVLDFGLAKLTGPLVSRSAHVQETAEGLMMGTVRYMAPEQARGEETDARTDLFALGVVLYEMLAGRPPFAGTTAADVIGALLLQEPLPIPAAPGDVDRIVRTALRKERSQRYQTGVRLLEDLRSALRALDSGHFGDTIGAPWTEWMTLPGRPTPGGTAPARARPTAAPRRKRARETIDSLAVLPLVAEGAGPELEYLGDGLTESLINSLSQMPRLRVMARGTVFRYRAVTSDPQAIGRELGVQAVVSGRVTERGEVVVVSAELIDVDDGSQLWGSVLRRRPSDLFTLQAEIARELTDALRLRLTREQKKRLAKRHTANAAAYQLYLRGRYSGERAHRPGAHRGAGAARARRRRGSRLRARVRRPGRLPLAARGEPAALDRRRDHPPGARGRAEVARARRDARRRPRLAGVHQVPVRLGLAAGRSRVRPRNRASTPGTRRRGSGTRCSWLARSRFDAALAEMRTALDLDPLSLVIQAGIGRILHFSRRFDEAITQYEHVLQTNPAYGQAHVDLALTRLAAAEFAAVRAALERAETLMGRVSTILLLRGICAVRQGLVPEARAVLDELRAWHRRGVPASTISPCSPPRSATGMPPCPGSGKPVPSARRSSAMSTSSRR